MKRAARPGELIFKDLNIFWSPRWTSHSQSMLKGIVGSMYVVCSYRVCTTGFQQLAVMLEFSPLMMCCRHNYSGPYIRFLHADHAVPNRIRLPGVCLHLLKIMVSHLPSIKKYLWNCSRCGVERTF